MNVEALHNPENNEIRYRIRGSLSADHAHVIVELKDRLTEDLEKGLPWRYLLDCEFITSLDSSGIGILIFMKSKISNVKGQFVLINVPDHIMKSLNMARMDSLFTIE